MLVLVNLHAKMFFISLTCCGSSGRKDTSEVGAVEDKSVAGSSMAIDSPGIG